MQEDNRTHRRASLHRGRHHAAQAIPLDKYRRLLCAARPARALPRRGRAEVRVRDLKNYSMNPNPINTCPNLLFHSTELVLVNLQFMLRLLQVCCLAHTNGFIVFLNNIFFRIFGLNKCFSKIVNDLILFSFSVERLLNFPKRLSIFFSSSKISLITAAFLERFEYIIIFLCSEIPKLSDLMRYDYLK